MEKNLDSKGRWRNKIVAFRVSPEEAEQTNDDDIIGKEVVIDDRRFVIESD